MKINLFKNKSVVKKRLDLMETDLSLCFKGGIGLSERMGRHFKFKKRGRTSRGEHIFKWLNPA